jgi:Mandelate racemase / muconate lactonizing enzyme, N-terminal domain
MLDDTPREVNRRSFFKTLGLGAAGAMAMTGNAAADAAADFVQAGVKRASEPSALKITDLRTAVVVGAPMTCPLIRVDTNQGLVGWGEVRDGSSETYALFLKSRILGENPYNVDKIFRKIRQFGGHARQAGGVCGIEMAMMDLAGKAWGVPCWQMLGGKFRDRVRLYADTTERDTPKEQGQMLKAWLPHQGPSRVAQILHEVKEKGHASHITALFFDLADRTEDAERRSTDLIGRHTGRKVLANLLIEMKRSSRCICASIASGRQRERIRSCRRPIHRRMTSITQPRGR